MGCPTQVTYKMKGHIVYYYICVYAMLLYAINGKKIKLCDRECEF